MGNATLTPNPAPAPIAAPPSDEQAIYNELNSRGVFKSDPEAANIGHELRARGVVSDPTQGGVVPTQSSPPQAPRIPFQVGSPYANMPAPQQRIVDASTQAAQQWTDSPFSQLVQDKTVQAAAGLPQNTQLSFGQGAPTTPQSLNQTGVASPSATTARVSAVASLPQFNQDVGKFGTPVSRQNIAPDLSVVKYPNQQVPYFYNAQGARVVSGQDPRVANYIGANHPDMNPLAAGGIVDQGLQQVGSDIGTGLYKADRAIYDPIVRAAASLGKFVGANPSSAVGGVNTALKGATSDIGTAAASVPQQLMSAARLAHEHDIASDNALRARIDQGTPQGAQEQSVADQANTAFNKGASATAFSLAPYSAGPALQKALGQMQAGDRAGASKTMAALPAGIWSYVQAHPILAGLDTLSVAGALHMAHGAVDALGKQETFGDVTESKTAVPPQPEPIRQPLTTNPPARPAPYEVTPALSDSGKVRVTAQKTPPQTINGQQVLGAEQGINEPSLTGLIDRSKDSREATTVSSNALQADTDAAIASSRANAAPMAAHEAAVESGRPLPSEPVQPPSNNPDDLSGLRAKLSPAAQVKASQWEATGRPANEATLGAMIADKLAPDAAAEQSRRTGQTITPQQWLHSIDIQGEPTLATPVTTPEKLVEAAQEPIVPAPIQSAKTASGKPGKAAKTVADAVQVQAEPAPQGPKTVTVNGNQHLITPEMQTEMDDYAKKAAYIRRTYNDAANPRGDYQTGMKAAGRQHAANMRNLTGDLTPKETANAAAREATNYVGKRVSVKGNNGEVAGNPFGRVHVKFDDGTEGRFDKGDIAPPSVAKGPQGTAYTSDNEPIAFHWEIRPAADLVTSHNDNFGPNPQYDQSLQPRDRSRIASADQVLTMAQTLNPERLGPNSSASEGAPIVGPDMQVESGNGRTMAIKTAYAHGGRPAADYQSFVQDQADRLGLRMNGVSRPVLVRVRDTPVSSPAERADLADRMGKTGVASMSETETAKNDGAKLQASGILGQIVPSVNGDFTTGANRDFVRGFTSLLNSAERAGMMQSDGTLSAAGARRVRNAVISAAYGDPSTIARLTESTDDNVKGVGTAMVATAPKFAQLKAAIADGSRYPGLDLTPDIADAAKTLSHLRNTGATVDSHLAQTDMFTEPMTPPARALLRLFDKYKRSPGRITDILDTYATAADKAGNPAQIGLFEGSTPPTRDEMLTGAVKTVEARNARTPANQQDMDFGTESQPSARGRDNASSERGDASANPGDTTGANTTLFQDQGSHPLTVAAQSHFGITNDPYEGGYITQDGKMLDFSGRHDGGPDKGTRTVDHRELPAELTNESGTKGLTDFMGKSGAARINYAPNVFGGGDLSAEISRPLTPDQIGTIRRIGRSGNVTLDVSDPETGKVSKTFKVKNASDAQIMGIVRQANKEAGGDSLFQTQAGLPPRGSVTFTKDGRTLLRILKGADASTGIHELGHIVRNNLNPTDLKLANDFTGVEHDLPGDVKGGWGEKDSNGVEFREEKFANAFTKFLQEGKAPTPELHPVFAKFKAWLTDLWSKISDPAANVEISPEMRGLFSRLLGGEGGAREASPEKLTTPVKSTYEGSVNERIFHNGKVNPEVAANIKAYADKKGYNDPNRSLTLAEMQDLGKRLGLNYDDFKSLPPGHIPPPPEGMRLATWQGAWQGQAMNLHAYAQKIDLIDAQHDARAAAEEERDNPSPDATADRRAADAKVAAAQENANAMFSWVNEAHNTWGVTGNVLNTPTEADAPGAGLTMRAKSAANDAQIAKEATAEVKAEKSGRTLSGTGQKGRPVSERTVSETELAEAAARYKAEKQPKVYAQAAAPKSDDANTLYQMADTDPLYKVGRYHYEDGSRSGPHAGSTWRNAVEKTVGPISDIEARETYAAVRGDVAAAAKTRTIRAADVVLGPYLTELGSKGTAQFLRGIPDDIRHRLLAGDPVGSFNPSERQAINDEYEKAKTKPNPSPRATSVAAQIIKEDNAPARKAAASARAKARAAANKAANPVHPFDEAVGRKVVGGQATATKIRAHLTQDALGQSVVDKISGTKTGRITDEEGRRLAQAIDAQKRVNRKPNPSDVTARLTKILADARQGRLGYDNPKEEVQTQLNKLANAPVEKLGRGASQDATDKAKANVAAQQKAISDDLAGVDPHDLDALSKVMMKHAGLDNARQFSQYILGNILSNPDTGEKIAVSHPATVALNELTRAFSGGHPETLAGISAGFKGLRERGIPEANTILRKGVTTSHLTGKNWYRPPGAKIPVESRLALHRAILRAHSAYYQMVQTYNTERGLHLQAWEDGKAKGLTGQDLADHITDIQLHPEDHPELVKKAVQFGKEETLTQENPIAKAVSDAAAKFGKPGRIAKTVGFPVLNLPLNSMKALLDYQTGLLTNVAQARLYAAINGKDYSAPEVQALKAKIRNRGAIGAGVAAAAALATAAGKVIPPDPKRGRYTSAIRLPGGHMIDAPAGAMGGLIDTGSSIAHDIHTRDFSQLMPQLMEPYESENPLSRAAGTVSDLAGAISGSAQGGAGAAAARAGNRALGGLITELQPLSGLTTFAGNVEDAVRNAIHPGTGGIRQKGRGPFPQGAADYAYNAEPVLRTHELPLEGPMRRGVRVGPPYPQEILHMNTAATPEQLKAYDAQDKRARMIAIRKSLRGIGKR